MEWVWAGLLVRSAVILLAADILRRVPRRTTPAYRHGILLAGFALLMMGPFFAAVIPEIHVPMWPRPEIRGSVTVQQTMLLMGKNAPGPHILRWPIAIWMIGVGLALTPVMIGYLNVFRMARRAIPIAESGWRSLLEQLCDGQKVAKRPELLMASEPVMPLTFGLLRPRILLPPDAVDWPASRRRMVLLHELAHVQRRDIFAQLLASVATALWWFQPLCWMSRWSLRGESERACDAMVLASGVRGSDYATELLEVAQSFRCDPRWLSIAIPMARRSELEGRVRAILEPRPSRTGRRLSLAAVAILTLLTITASAVTLLPEQKTDLRGGSPMRRTLLSGLLTSAGLSAATIGGALFDSTGAALADAKVSLYNPDTAATQDAITTSDGKFTFGALPAGQYILRIEKPGFASLFREFNVERDATVERGLVLKLGAAQEQGNLQAAEGARAAYQQPSNGQQLRIGGIAQQAKLTSKTQPIYPAAAKAAGIQGTVMLETVISTEGVPKEIRVMSSPSDDLTQSALEAVRQWRYSSTLLNGRPVEVLTDVMVNYTLAR